MYCAISSALGQSKPQRGAKGTACSGSLLSLLFTILILALVNRITMKPGSLFKVSPSKRF